VVNDYHGGVAAFGPFRIETHRIVNGGVGLSELQETLLKENRWKVLLLENASGELVKNALAGIGEEPDRAGFKFSKPVSGNQGKASGNGRNVGASLSSLTLRKQALASF